MQKSIVSTNKPKSCCIILIVVSILVLTEPKHPVVNSAGRDTAEGNMKAASPQNAVKRLTSLQKPCWFCPHRLEVTTVALEGVLITGLTCKRRIRNAEKRLDIKPVTHFYPTG